jgi:hypothetical protein
MKTKYRGIIYSILSAAIFSAAIVAPSVAQQPIANPQPQKRMPRITVTHISFHGWDAIMLRNQVAEITIVPAIGRVMSFGFTNENSADETAQNVFWNNPAVGTAQKPDIEGWTNYGGDKVWPAPQSDWPKNAGNAWPPPKAFDAMPYMASVEGDQVQLLSSVSPIYGIRVRRTIALDPQEPVMTIKTTYEKVQGEPVSVAVWSITQVLAPERAFILLPKQSAFPHGYVNMLPEQPKELKSDGRLLSLVRDPQKNTMIGSDGDTLLSVGQNSDLLIENKTPVLPGSKVEWPDHGLHSKIFTSGNDLKYMELEIFSPLSLLKLGHSISMESSYTLIPKTEHDPMRESKKVFAADLR